LKKGSIELKNMNTSYIIVSWYFYYKGCKMSIEDIISKNDLGQPYSCLVDFDLNDIFEVERLLQGRQIKFSKNLNLNYEFKELIDSIGIKKVQKIVNIFYGEIVYFPKIKETCKDKIKNKIIKEFNGHNYTQLAKKYGYTERRIRDIVKSINRDNKISDKQISIFDYISYKKN